MNKITITWNEAQHQAQIIEQKTKQNQEEKLAEFLESNTEMFDWRDFEYYARETGKTANELRRLHPQLEYENAIHTFGMHNDDVINFY
jgi:hypothetical protein